MAKKLPKETQEIIAKYGLTQEDVWDCHGTWVIYHKALERIAADNGIDFEPPRIVVSDMEKKHVAILVTGVRPREDGAEITEWSIGEAAPYNSKNSYPFAMAEKRAKDRVILKLLGLHGDFYSEEEADEFKEKETQPKTGAPGNLFDPEYHRQGADENTMIQERPRRMSMQQIQKQGIWETIVERLDRFTKADDYEFFDEYRSELREKAKEWPQGFNLQLSDLLSEKDQELKAMDQLQMQGAAAE